jgi:hypothetical protein
MKPFWSHCAQRACTARAHRADVAACEKSRFERLDVWKAATVRPDWQKFRRFAKKLGLTLPTFCVKKIP